MHCDQTCGEPDDCSDKIILILLKVLSVKQFKCYSLTVYRNVLQVRLPPHLKNGPSCKPCGTSHSFSILDLDLSF